MSTLSLSQLMSISLNPVVKAIRRWWLTRAANHYALCAEVEQARAREAQQNVAYYQKRSALAKSELNNL